MSPNHAAKQSARVSGRQVEDIPGLLVTEFPGDYEWLTLRVLCVPALPALLDPVFHPCLVRTRHRLQ